MTPALLVEALFATFVPLFFGSVGAVHQLRGGKRDFGESVRITALVWLGLGCATAAAALMLIELGLGA
jgi:hypothetical protein